MEFFPIFRPSPLRAAPRRQSHRSTHPRDTSSTIRYLRETLYLRPSDTEKRENAFVIAARRDANACERAFDAEKPAREGGNDKSTYGSRPPAPAPRRANIRIRAPPRSSSSLMADKIRRGFRHPRLRSRRGASGEVVWSLSEDLRERRRGDAELTDERREYRRRRRCFK